MMNLSSHSKSIILQVAALGLGIGAFWATGVQNGLLVAYGLMAVAVVALLGSLYFGFRQTWLFNQVTAVSNAIRAGDFDQRIIAPKERGNLAKLVNGINSMIDVNDAFVREAYLALEAASRGKFYRKIRKEGMNGMFGSSIDKVNSAIDLMARAEQDRAEVVRELRSQIGFSIDAAVQGDYSKRIPVGDLSGEFADIGQQVNELVSTVDRGLTETGEVLGALARQDLSLRVEGDYQGAFLKLKNDTNDVADKLGDVISRLKDTSKALKLATNEILAGANDLSERTLKQAATIEETSATMEQLSATVSDSAAQADEANRNSMSLSATAEKSGLVVQKATDAMAQILNSSNKISSVIGMIDDIAFQTNLLALNASVEAARAGDAGKGFAVVAVEVRRLAQSAAEASAEVKQLIEASAAEVDTGNKYVSEVSENLKAMIGAIQSNGEKMRNLADASRGQAGSIEEINEAVRQMDQITQHNAALVEETNAAIEQTNTQVIDLDAVVEMFKLSQSSQSFAHQKTTPSEDTEQLSEKAA